MMLYDWTTKFKTIKGENKKKDMTTMPIQDPLNMKWRYENTYDAITSKQKK